MTVLQTISLLEEEPSRNGKEAILKSNDSAALRYVLEACYNPFKRYNIDSKIDHLEGCGKEDLNLALLDRILTKLSTRELSGDAAVDQIETLAYRLKHEHFEVFRRILKKDLRCGIADSTINKVFKNLIPTFDVQLAQKPERIDKMVYPAYIEPKFDGMRCLVVYDGETVQFLSRSGKEITTLDYMIPEVKTLLKRPGVLDTEVMSATFLDTISSVRRKTSKDTNSKLFVFDYIPYNDFQQGKCDLTQKQRADMLMDIRSECYECLTNVVFSTKFVVHSKEEAFAKFAEFLEQGYEGAIVKNMNAPYQFKRNDAWIKLKKQLDDQDLEIIGYEVGTGKYDGKLGAFIVDFNGVAVKVGSGFSDEQREEFWEKRNEMIGWLIEVQGMEVTPDGSIRHPVFLRVRSYKGSKA